ncbi:MAG: hypothetical protein H7222_14925 [Methylotenera sp.]|nr:hypothetical protein [Oligoflexia bacterium]
MKYTICNRRAPARASLLLLVTSAAVSLSTSAFAADSCITQLDRQMRAVGVKSVKISEVVTPEQQNQIDLEFATLENSLRYSDEITTTKAKSSAEAPQDLDTRSSL